jgi:hypothetical protein
VAGWIWRDSTQEGRTAMLEAQTACGNPDAKATSGLVADVDGDPASGLRLSKLRPQSSRYILARLKRRLNQISGPITSPPTVVRDLRERRSAQRSARDC